MAQYPKITLTNSGLNMIAESQGGAELIFTKMVMGDGELTSGEDIKVLTDIKKRLLTIPLQGFLNQGEGQVRLRFAVSNESLSTGFFAREIGIYAKLSQAGAEQLYAYTNAGNKSDYMPDKSVPLDSQILDLYLIVGNASSVSAILDANASYATKLDLDEHNQATAAHTNIITTHNTDVTAHTNGISGNAATATRLKPALNGSRNQCWLLCKLPKAATALVHYKILGAQYYDQYSTLEVVIKNGFGWCKYTGRDTNWQVCVRAYDTGTSIDVYLFAPGYCDFWELFLQKSTSAEFAYQKMGDATYVPTGTLVCDTSTGLGMYGVELFNGKSSTGESIGHVGFTISNIPEGCLTLDTGALVNRATYPALWQFVQSNKNLLPVLSDAQWQTIAGNQTSVAAFSTGDDSTTFRLPKLLDYPRGGTVVDVGAWYGDAIRNITGVCTANGGAGFCTASGAMYVSDRGGATATGTPVNTHYDDLGIDISRQVPTAAENRPKTIVGIFYIRAFHGTTNEGNVDITVLANEKADVNLSNINDVGKQTILNNVISSGNGYLKFANGTLMQYGGIPAVVAGGYAVVTYPISFLSGTQIALGTCVAGTAPYPTGYGWGLNGMASNGTPFSDRFVAYPLGGVGIGGSSYIAIGRWK